MKKTYIIGFIILTFIIGVIIYKITNPTYKKGNFITDKPEEWVEKINNTYFLNLLKTGDNYIISGNRQQIKDYVFFINGVYKGEPFEIAYLVNDFDKQEIKLMEITKNLNPNNNIIEAYIVAKKENEDMNIYIFVDEDWKKQLKFTNILYGEDFNDKKTLTQKEFEFNEIKTGIYMDKIQSDWYEKDPVRGGILVGEINIENLENPENSTFIIFR